METQQGCKFMILGHRTHCSIFADADPYNDDCANCEAYQADLPCNYNCEFCYDFFTCKEPVRHYYNDGDGGSDLLKDIINKPFFIEGLKKELFRKSKNCLNCSHLRPSKDPNLIGTCWKTGEILFSSEPCINGFFLKRINVTKIKVIRNRFAIGLKLAVDCFREDRRPTPAEIANARQNTIFQSFDSDYTTGFEKDGVQIREYLP